jgi:penicillin amidase
MILLMRRLLLKAVGLLILLAAIACGAAYLYARRSLPMMTGTIEVAGISAAIEIVRDVDAIPHIFASSRRDGLFGLGYVHAQDRLWQMEFQRRIGFGRLSEIFGAATIPQDRFLRTVGFGRAARAAWARFPDRVKKDIEAYVAGVNAFLATHHGAALPPEFTLLRFEPATWTGVDVVVWQKMMAWDLSANYSAELLRHDLAAQVGLKKLAELMPPYAATGLSILSEHALDDATRQSPLRVHPAVGQPACATTDCRSGSALSAFLSALSQGQPAVRDLLVGGSTAEALGSNNWVVDGTLSASGRPLLANDPHLSARLPSVWYLAHIATGADDVIGASIPGTPPIVLGRNRYIAWAATNVAADVEDLYREKIDPTGRFAEFRGQWEALTLIPETIVVKGGRSVQVDVRVSRHGPLVSDAINANNASAPAGRAGPSLEPLALRWTALDEDDTTLAASMHMSEAQNWDEFTEALRDFVVPAQNFLYADVAGHIGYYAPGRIPIRASGDGAMPSAGWTGESEWIGWVPFSALPHVYDPPGHMIVTANQRPMPAGYSYFLGLEWPESYRAQRISDLLRSKAKLTADDFAAIQADTVSLHAQTLLPRLLARVHPVGAADLQAVRVLRKWNHDARADSAGAAIFSAWFLHLAPTLVGDKLTRRAVDNYSGRFSFLTRFLLRSLEEEDSPWCDDTRTRETETCNQAVTNALHAAVADLTRQLGGNMTRWRWDVLHRAIFPHQGLDSVSALRPLLSRSMASAGDWSTVDVGAVATDAAYEQHAIVSYREIIDLSPKNDSRFIDALGQSGHPFSAHYDDFLQDWRTVKHRPMRMERADIERGAIGHLRLVP